MSTNTIVVVGSLIVAILVSINQVYKKIHSVLDVLMGAITGAAITLILYWIFY